jgi:transposase
MTQTIHQHLAAADRLPTTHLVDAGYVDAEHLVDSQRDYQVDLFGPIPVASNWQAQAGNGFDAASFTIAWEERYAICPQGKRSCWWRHQRDSNGNPTVNITFAVTDCHACPVREHCTEAKRTGRQLNIREREPYEAMQAARQRQQTPAFQAQYALRAGIEGSLSQGGRRCGLRQARYVGEAKTRLQELFVATALNIARVSTFLAGEAFKERTEPPFVRLMHALA